MTEPLKINFDSDDLIEGRYTNPSSWWMCRQCGHVVSIQHRHKCPRCNNEVDWLPGIWHADGTLAVCDEEATQEAL